MRYTITPTRTPEPHMVKFCETMLESGYTPIVLCAEPYDNLPEGTVFLTKTGETFNSWVNQGLDYIKDCDPQGLAISINSDIEAPVNALNPMFEALESGDVLVGLKGWESLTGGITPLRGHLWGLNPHKGIRLEEEEGLPLWWWNTDILYHHVKEAGEQISFVDVDYTHKSNNEERGAWYYPQEFAYGAQADHDYYWEIYWEKDPTHSSCYWNNWPQTIPEGQTHKTHFNPAYQPPEEQLMRINKTEYPIYTAETLLPGLQPFFKYTKNLNNLKPRNPSMTFTPEGELIVLLPAAKYAIKPAHNPEEQDSYWHGMKGENEWATRIYYLNLTNHTPGKRIRPREVTYNNHECYDPRIYWNNKTQQLESLLHNHFSKKMEVWVLNKELTLTKKATLGVHHANRKGMREKNWMTTPDGRYIVDHTTIANPVGQLFKPLRTPVKYNGTRGGGNIEELQLPDGTTTLVGITHKTINRVNSLPIYTNQFTYYNPTTLQITAQTPDFKFSNQAVEFTSGFTINPDNTTAYIGYGVSDWEAHIQTIPTTTLINLYYTYKDNPHV